VLFFHLKQSAIRGPPHLKLGKKRSDPEEISENPHLLAPLIDTMNRALFSIIRKAFPYLLICSIAGVLILRHVGVTPSVSRAFTGPIEDGLWFDSYQMALETALNSQKPMLVYFSADWCAPCIRLEESIFPDFRVRQELSEVVAVKVDASEMRGEISSILKKYRISGLPTIAFFRPPSDVLVSPRIEGFIEAEELVKHIRYVTASGP
tara:strand:+ start:14 stop:634 length:621 start_codon:yes stop_codon:yes gene_type:complete